MILRTSPASPFGRKVKIAAAVLGLSERIEIVPADTSDPSDDLRVQNPLGKLPVLVTDDGTALYDSPVIVEYLDHLAGGGRLIPAGAGRFDVLTLQALADGLIDAAIMQVYEVRFRPEERREPTWVDYQAQKVTRALDRLESRAGAIGDALDAGTIALACALGYLDFRFEGRWRASYPALVAWLDGFAARVPAFEKTRPS
ncbi:glutathione S-transferase family protein [Salinarimonas rosea]|uniref:glutathione S-transferase family protein n=1 Tax=Salinarimonas rosea TaxID=552063 RepID=UPI0003FF92D6|nr:glutathione S-transferase [Salinarimonas rosea]